MSMGKGKAITIASMARVKGKSRNEGRGKSKENGREYGQG